jgi:hypothetical protein
LLRVEQQSHQTVTESPPPAVLSHLRGPRAPASCAPAAPGDTVFPADGPRRDRKKGSLLGFAPCIRPDPTYIAGQIDAVFAAIRFPGFPQQDPERQFDVRL